MTKLHLIFSLLFCFTFATLAEEHAEGTLDGRNGAAAKGNTKYLSLCDGKGRTYNTTTPTKLDDKTLKAYDLLRNKCAVCHNARSEDVPSNLRFDLTDRDELVKHGLVVPGKADASTLIGRIEDDSMPASNNRVKSKPLTDDERKVLKDWISAGAKSFSTNAGDIPDVGFISNGDLEACMVKDLRNVNEEDKLFTRYLNLGNLYNSGRRAEIERTRLALNKLLNSLSWKKQIKNPIVIDGTGTLLRIDLRDYRWTPEQWEEIAKLNPYPEALDSAKEKELAEKTGSNTPHLRGDWVVFSASKPPLYHNLLGLPQKNGNVGADTSLENILFVNAKQNEDTGDMTRAGFKKSNVTKFNRIIDQHETPFGSYWKSADFENNDGKKNVFEHPIDFERNGGEFIFNLPNGLQGYLVTDAKGNRLDEAPTNIVIDPLRLDKNGAVVNGISCMSCHTRGMKRHDDEVLPHHLGLEKLLAKTPDANLQETIRQVKKLYKDNKTLNEKYSEGEKIYAAAIKKTGGSVEQDEPVFATTHAFEAPLDIRSVAAELGHEPEKVEELINNDLNLGQRLQLGAAHTVDRDVFNQNFRLLRGLLDGNGGGGLGVPGVVSSDPGFDKHFDFVRVKAGTFIMGSPSNEIGRSSDEIQHQVTISKPFEIQTTEVTQSLWEKVMGNNPSGIKGAEKPVETVSWDDITEKEKGFLDRLNKLRKSQGDRCTYRLPTEAEWEYAARGGNQVPDDQMQTAYSFGNDAGKFSEFGVFDGNSGYQSQIVKSKKANPLGISDMHGNVWEWVQDAYRSDYEKLPSTDPVNESGPARVARGSAWFNDARGARSAFRNFVSPAERSSGVGFRLVRTCP